MSTLTYESGHSVRSQAYVFAVGIVLGMVVARELGPGSRGVLSLAQQVFTLAVMLGGLGFHAAVRYHVARAPDALHDSIERGTALTLVSAVSSLLVYALTYLALGGGLLAGVRPVVVALFAALTLVNVVSAYVTALVYGDGDVIGINQISMIAISARAVLIAVFVAAGLTIEGVVLAALGTELTTIVLLGRRAHRRLGTLFRRPSFRANGAMIRYGLSSMISTVLQWLNYRADIFILAALRSDADVGRYTVAVSLAEILMRGASSLARPLFPRVARESLPPSLTARACRMAVLAVGASGAALVAPAVLAQLYLGEAYEGMLPAFFWLLPGSLAFAVGHLLHFDLLARGAVGRLAVANATSLAVNVALNLLLVPRHGILGAAGATSIAYTLNLLAVGLMFRSMHATPLARLFIPRRADLIELRTRFRAFALGVRGA